MRHTTRLAASAALILALAGSSALAYAQRTKTDKTDTPKPAASATKAPTKASEIKGWGPGPVVFQHPYNVWPQTYSDLTPDPMSPSAHCPTACATP